MTSLFSAVTLAPRDPILGLNESFNADTRDGKTNLGVGVYFTDIGKIPLLRAVQKAEAIREAAHAARGYLAIEGINTYNQGVQNLLFGTSDAGKAIISEGRAVTAQTIGGTGALKIGADFIKRLSPNSTVSISDPSWENHRALFEAAGFVVNNYPYYNAANHGVKFDEMLAYFKGLAPNSVVVLHACCHNPTGVDLTVEQWKEVVAVCQSAQLIPFLDMAYQGFADGIAEDGIAIDLFAASGLQFFVSSSFSKSFSLYGERVGALTVVTETKEEAARVLSQVKRVIRTNYSNPPTHGGTIVSMVLNSPELRADWEAELGEMRVRIKQMREAFVNGLKERGVARDFGFVAKQRGMFSYSGLTESQVDTLRTEHGIYAVGTGRICVAALNTYNLPKVLDAIAAVCKV
jgi:aromatic-amino-acid transaminase